jgi:hypothetical protein
MLLISSLIGALMAQQRAMIAALNEIARSESSFRTHSERPPPVLPPPPPPPPLSTASALALALASASASRRRNSSHQKDYSYRTTTTTAAKTWNCRYQQSTLSFPLAPNLIIIGAQKAGTSALAEFLATHPQMEPPSPLSSRNFEAHFMDWTIPLNQQSREEQIKKERLDNEDELFCRYRSEYSHMWNDTKLLSDPTKVSFEKTPSYLFLAYAIPDILIRVCPWKPKLLAILRNPVDRAWSQFNMDKRMKSKFMRKNDTFERILEREIDALRRNGLSFAPTTIEAGVNRTDPRFHLPNHSATTTTIQQHQDQIDIAHQRVFRKVFLSNYLQRGMYAVQLTRWKQVFGNDLMVVNYDDLFGPHAQRCVNSILRFVGVEEWKLPHEFGTHWSRNNYRSKISNTTRDYLESFFRPHNEQLSTLLGERWTGVWTT